MGLILGTHHVSLKAQGYAAFEKALAFYHGVLQMPVVRVWGAGDGSGAMLSTGNSLMEITANGEDTRASGSIRHFALAVEDVAAVTELVRRAGYKIIVEPKDAVLPSDPPYNVSVAFCTGPCNEEIEFFHER